MTVWLYLKIKRVLHTAQLATGLRFPIAFIPLCSGGVLHE
jgi:hypothetical protein